MIKVSNLSKIFRTEEIETTALNGVSFEIKDGEFVAIIAAISVLYQSIKTARTNPAEALKKE